MQANLFEYVESKLNNMRNLIMTLSKLEKDDLEKNFKKLKDKNKFELILELLGLNAYNIKNYVNEILDTFIIDNTEENYNNIESYFIFLLDIKNKYFMVPN